MEKDELTQIWKSQKNSALLDDPNNIIKKAQKQRKGQFVTIAVLSITLLVLVAFTFKYAGNHWSNFTLGLLMMIFSLAFRVILEFISIYQKKNKLIALDNQTFQDYLKQYYGRRIQINYVITPICFGLYLYGFTMLLPYFKKELSEGFYTYIVYSGIVSLIVVSTIVVKSTLKERNFLQQLNPKPLH